MPERKRPDGAKPLTGAGKQRAEKTDHVKTGAAGDPAEFRVNYLIHDVSRLRRTLFDQEMRPYGITHVQWTTLAQLSRNPTGTMTQAELARLLGAGKVAISRVIDRLEKSGLVKRSYDKNDRRVNLVGVTPEAESILGRMTEVSRQLNQRLLEDVEPQHIAAMERALATIKRNARALLHDTTDIGEI